MARKQTASQPHELDETVTMPSCGARSACQQARRCDCLLARQPHARDFDCPEFAHECGGTLRLAGTALADDKDVLIGEFRRCRNRSTTCFSTASPYCSNNRRTACSTRRAHAAGLRSARWVLALPVLAHPS
jgi:hypothetical protein